MKVQAHILRDVRLQGWKEKIEGRWSYRDLAADPDWFHGWISFDAVCFNPDDRKLYCGLNSMDGDLLYRFDPETGAFESLGTSRWTDRFDVKIHRTLLHNPADRCLYFATSMLHDMDEQQKARGGKLVRYDPAADRYDLLGVPAPRLYIQSIAADWARSSVYSFTYPAEGVFRTNLRGGVSHLVAWIGNAISFAQPHNAAVDGDGWLWGTWAETRAWDEAAGTTPVRLFKYHPDDDRLVFFDHGLPRRETPLDALAATRHKQDWGFCDSMAYDGGQYIYAGTVAGVLARINCATGSVEKIADAISGGRFPALAIADGILYGAGGMHGHTQLIRWRIGSSRVETFDDLVDPGSGERPARIHELAVDQRGRIWLAENDNHRRSSWLWSVDLEA